MLHLHERDSILSSDMDALLLDAHSDYNSRRQRGLAPVFSRSPVASLSELVLLAGLCVEAVSTNARGPLPIDTKRIAMLARRHRLQGLAHLALARRGIQEVAADAQAVAADALRAAAASRELRDAFERAGLPLLFLKGLPVGKLAYGDPTRKMSADLDVLIPPGGLQSAAGLLRHLGYAPVLPRRQDRLSAWHQRFKESVWTRAGSPPLELHTALTDNPSLLDRLDPFERPQDVEVLPGLFLPTLGPSDQFAYLAVHGASSAWFRLKWLCDFAALLPADEGAVVSLSGRAAELGAGRAPGWALLLSHQMFGTVLPAVLRDGFNRDRAYRTLLPIALRQLQSIREPSERPLGTLGIHASQILLKPGVPFAAAEAARQAGDTLMRRRLG